MLIRVRTELSSIKLYEEVGSESYIKFQIYFFQSQNWRIHKYCEITFYISMPNFRILGSLI